MFNRRKIGEIHEERALCHLKRAGLRLIDRNFQCRSGEIDLICIDKRSQLVFVEVRFRKSISHGSAAATVTQEKQRRIKQTAAMFLQKNAKYRELICRFDVVAIQGLSTSDSELTWIKNAFY